MTHPQSEWRQTGDTTLAACEAALARSWTAQKSPMAAEAEGIYDAVWASGLSRLACSMAWHETKNWTWHCGTAPTGQPCIPERTRNPWAFKAPGGGWREYASFSEAARDWARRLTDPAGPYAKTVTIRDLVMTYAPPAENLVDQYVDVICREIDALPLLSDGGMPMPTNPFPKPTIYSLTRDFARYGLGTRQRDDILSHRFPDRQGLGIRGIVLHIQEGNTSGSLAYWASPGVNASSSVMVQKDGTLLRVIEDQFGPWTNGDVQNPSERGRKFLDGIGWANPNLATVSIEAEGYYQDAMPEAQLNTICWMVTEWMQRHDLGIGDIYRHADINSVTRPNCPGVYYDRVIAKLGGGQPAPQPVPPAVQWPGKPSWMPDYLIPIQFPEAEPGGVRTSAWLRYCGEVGRAPARTAFLQKGTPDELILFSDGMLLDRSGTVVGRG